MASDASGLAALTIAPCAAAAALLLVAGIAKIATPAPATAMIIALFPRVGRRVAAPLVRVVGVVECGVAAAALTIGGRTAALALVGAYLVLTVVAVRLATGAQRTPCGCFGAADGEVGVTHVVVNVACVAAAAAAAVRASAPVIRLWDGGAVGAVLIAQVVLLAASAYLLITALPALAAAARALDSSTGTARAVGRRTAGAGR